MRPGSARVPFAERGGHLRGVIDLATGVYPAFLFGGAIGQQLPVFHIHEVTPASLEPRLRHVAENGYRTLVADEIADFIRSGRLPFERSVALTFDDAWASLWTVAAPLLRRYGLRATAFAIPGRVSDAASVRPTLDDGAADGGREDESGQPLATWPELQSLQASGTIDVQAHSLTHILQFCSAEPVGFVTPAFAREPLLNRPIVSTDGPPRFLEPSALGAPIYARRSRLSDGLRFVADPAVGARLAEHVAVAGGASFFERQGWERELRALVPAAPGRFESADDQFRAIERELAGAREVLESRLRTPVRHVALPWGVAGGITRRLLERAGYLTAFADRLFHARRVRRGDDPYWLMRLNAKFIPCLPGRGRRTFFSTV
jgi:peptidoglycan/xylan/chitin deacetylase (PgdA/CDA1 family)